MNKNLEYFRKMSGSYKLPTEKDRIINNVSRSYNNSYKHTISTFDLLINTERADIVYKNQEALKCIIDYNKKWNKSNVNPLWREVWIDHSLISTGDVVDFENKYSKEKQTYLFISDIETRKGYDIGFMQRTNCTLKWLNSNGDICLSPCIVEDATKYSDGIYDNNKIKVGDTRIQVTFPKNEDTKEFDIGKRFVFDKKHAYEISDNKVTSPKGLLLITMIQTQINKATDDLDKLIADYKGKAHQYSIKILNKTTILSQDKTLKLQVEVYDRNKKVDTDEIIYSTSDESIATVDENGLITGVSEGNVTISVQFKDIKETFDLQVIKQEIDNYSCKIEGEDCAFLGSNEDYLVRFYHNGQEIKSIATWSITDENNKETNYAKVISTTNTTCTIKVTKEWIFTDYKTKYIYLHCKDITGKEDIKKISIEHF